jgi:hypothetical protein
MSIEMAADKVGLALYELGDCYSDDMTDEQVDILHEMAALNRILWMLIHEQANSYIGETRNEDESNQEDE